jgi:hypothetical protein
MIVLALDPSTHCGFAHDGATPGKPIMGTKHLPSVDGNDNDGFDYGSCADHFFDWLWELIDVVQPDLLAYEAPLPAQVLAMQKKKEWITRMQYGLAWTIEQICRRRNIICHERRIDKIKKFWTNDAHANKWAMIKRCRTLGWDPKDDNQADAAAIWAMLKTSEEVGFQYATAPLFARSA